MSTDPTDKQRAMFRRPAGEVHVYAPPAWLTRSFVTWALIAIFTVGPVPVTFAFTAIDQWLRNKIDESMSDPDIYKSLSLKPDEYLSLPLRWRQALAEISVRPATADLAEVRELMKTLTPEQITLIDQIAPYVIDGLLIRDKDKPSHHPIPGLSLVDFETLEDLRILQNVRQGYRTPNQPLNIPFVLSGTTAALRIQRLGKDSIVSLPVTRLTEPGNTLIGLLRTPSDIRYFEWIAKEIDQDGVSVTVWATGAHYSEGQIRRALIALWPE